MASSSVPIPPRQHQRQSSSSYSSTSSFSSTPSSAAATPSSVSSSSKGKAAVLGGTPERIAPRRPSLLGTSLSRSEHTVINLGSDEGPPRLVMPSPPLRRSTGGKANRSIKVTCVKSSQGFDWNQELFLPSYANHFDAQQLEHKRDPVHDIVLSEEDAADMLPK